MDSPTRPPTSSLIVVKGLLDRRRGVVRVGVGVGVGVGGSASGAAQCPPTEWMLIVSKIEGTIVRFVAGGLDLIEPGTGEIQMKNAMEIYGPDFSSSFFSFFFFPSNCYQTRQL